MEKDTFETVKQLLVERFAIASESITPNVELEGGLGLDSMDAMDLLLAVNETFSVRVSEQSLENIHTVSDLVTEIDKRKGI